MIKYDERTAEELVRDARITALEARFEALLKMPPVVVKLGDLRNRIEAVEERVQVLKHALDVLFSFSHVSDEISRQAIEMAGELANQFAAARAGEMQELTERVAKVESAIDLLPRETSGNEGRGEIWQGGRRSPPDFDYENPGPLSVSPLG